MNKNEIDHLLSKYYRGETTLDEEQQLLGALSDDSVDALLMKELEGVDNEIEVPADLESSLSDLIDQWDAEEQQEVKIAPSLWRRSAWWAAAASVAVLAVAGYWFMRNHSHLTTGDNPPVIAKVEKTVPQNNVDVEEPKQPIEELVTMPEQKSQLAVSDSRKDNRPAKAIRPQEVARQASHIAQNSNKDILSLDDERAAIEALEKFSNVLNKGTSHINEAGEKIENINNTIHKHLL